MLVPRRQERKARGDDGVIGEPRIIAGAQWSTTGKDHCCTGTRGHGLMLGEILGDYHLVFP